MDTHKTPFLYFKKEVLKTEKKWEELMDNIDTKERREKI